MSRHTCRLERAYVHSSIDVLCSLRQHQPARRSSAGRLAQPGAPLRMSRNKDVRLSKHLLVLARKVASSTSRNAESTNRRGSISNGRTCFHRTPMSLHMRPIE